MFLKKLVSTKRFIFNSQNVRKFYLTASNCEEDFASQNEVRLSWDQAVDYAIKFVNYQSPFKKLSYMTTDKNINWIKILEKLKQSGHPMRDVVEVLFTDENRKANRIWGIVILLVSKLITYPTLDLWNEDDIDKETGILKDQRKLAKCIELVATQNEIHRDGILNLQNLQKSGINLDNDSELIFGNKMAILAGDMLLAYASMMVTKLRNSKVTGLWGSFVRDNIDSTFIGDRDIQNNPLPSDPLKKLEIQRKSPEIFKQISSDQIDTMLPFKTHDIMGTAENEWKLRHTLGGASRLGKSFQAALIFGKQDEEKQKEIYFLGKHMYLSYRASKELSIFKSDELPSSGKFSLVSAPLLFHLEEDPSLYKEIRKGLETIEKIDFEKIHKVVRNGPGMEKSKELLNGNKLNSLKFLHKFPKSECRRVIENLILALDSS